MNGAFTYPLEIKGRLLRLRFSFFVMGGIIIQASLILVCITIRRFEPGAFHVSQSFDLSYPFIISNLLSICSSLIPTNFRSCGIKIPNDGLRIYRILFLSDKEFLASGLINEAHEYYEKKGYDKATDIYRRCIEIFPTIVIPKINLSSTLIKSLEFDEAKMSLLTLNEEKRVTEYNFLINNNLAWLSLLQNDQASLIEADKFSKMAYDLNPDVPSVRGTRGCSLIEIGQIDEGINLLKKNVHLNKPIEKEINNPVGFFFIAYAYYMKGEKDKARQYLKKLEGFENLDADYKYLFDIVKTKTGNFKEV
jgi:tetratricopeptide (TPR) repeat protein